MNPLDWSFGWTLAAVGGVVAAGVIVACIQAVRCAPTQCETCGRLVPPRDIAAHQRIHSPARVAAWSPSGSGSHAPAADGPPAD